LHDQRTKILEEIGNVQLIAVSKYQSIDAIRALYTAGQRHFGESRAQELVEKHAALPTDIQWHFIGHLQTNKIRQVLPLLTCIQSVDSEKLLDEIAQESLRINKPINVLLQVKVAQEQTKYGFLPADFFGLLVKIQRNQLNGLFKNIRFGGIMGMASNTDNETELKAEFKLLKTLFETLKTNFFAKDPHFSQLSMGMSGDYKLAIAEGSTMVRIGSLLFADTV
jgi:pyridoxal phosphate enzyme (YggS family)